MKTSIAGVKKIGYRRTVRCGPGVKFWPSLLLFLTASAAIFCTPLHAGVYQLLVGMEDHNSTIEITVGDIVVIELPGNAGTGFAWNFDKLDGAILSLMRTNKKIEREGEPGFVGNAYLQSWVLKAETAGTSSVRLFYYRPWEGKEMAEKKFTIEVVVNP